MADNPQPRALAAPFPTPPPFYKSFTKENLQRLRKIHKASGSNTETPTDLRDLVPPEPPADGRYKSFGISHDLNQPSQSLSAAGITQLYPTASSDTETQPDPTSHMLTLTRSILLNFLELVGVLSVNPAHYAEKIEHLQTLFYNVHDLINQYRPHQARESLILMMEEQVDKIRGEISAVEEGREKMVGLLKTIQTSGVVSQVELETKGGVNGVHEEEREGDKMRREMQRRQWEALDEELG